MCDLTEKSNITTPKINAMIEYCANESGNHDNSNKPNPIVVASQPLPLSDNLPTIGEPNAPAAPAIPNRPIMKV